MRHRQRHVALVLSVGLLAAVSLTSAEANTTRDVSVRRDLVRLPVEEASGLSVRRLSTADGLSQTRVSHVVQDDLGFLWFGTQYGLNRYDGYDFKVFVHEPGNDNSAAGTYLYSLFKDRDGLIWVGWNRGLDRFDPRTEVFTHYVVDPDAGAQLGDIIWHISQDREGMLWLATGTGLHRLDPKTGSLTHYRQGDPNGLPTNDVNWSGEDSRGRFWVGTRLGLSEFDRASGMVVRHLDLPDPVQVTLFEDRSGHFWIAQASGNGLALYDPDTNTVTPYSFYERDPEPAAFTGVMGIAEDADGNLWLGSPQHGLLQLNRDRNRFLRYAHQPQDVNSIAEDKIIALYQDRDGNIWTGLHSSGVNYFGRDAQRFEVFRHVPGDPNSLTLNFVNTIFEDRDGTLWIGNDDGLNRIDRRTGERRLVDIGLGAKPMVISLAQDRDGALWVGTFPHGVVRYDPRTETYETYSHDPANPRSLSNNQVHRVLVDSKGTVWLATDDGLNQFDPLTRDFTVYRVQANSRYSQGYITLTEDAAGYLWLASPYSGVHRFDPRTDQFVVYRRDPKDPNSLRDDTVPAVHMSREGTLWIGTLNGLNGLNPETGTMRSYDTRDGMAANAVACILEDELGDIWLGTTRGLSKLTPSTATFANYSLLDGLPGNDFTGWGACSKSARGELFFAGFAGAVGLVPAAFQEERVTAPLVLTDLEIDGAKAAIGAGQPLERSIAYSHRATLTHEQQSFTVTFAGLRYTRPETTRYRYRLDGVDGDWRESPSSIRRATYSTLPAASYTLHVQMAGDRGDWQLPGISLDITVLPAWWSTWWFITACTVAALALVSWGVRARIRYVAHEVTLQMEARNNERMRIAQDLHDTLLQGLLSASLQLSVAEDQLSPNAKARPLLERVSNLLRQLVTEGRNAVRGLRTDDRVTEDLARAISSVRSDLQIESAAEFHVFVEGEPRALLSAARTEVYLIAREAVSNALRHAHARTIEVTMDYRPDLFRLAVRDDGRGFTAGTASADGMSHFGLSVMSERAGRLGGAVAVSSGAGAGTEVVLTVPARAIYRSEKTRQSLERSI